MGLKFTDIVALAKEGYKPSDIKELISMSESLFSPTSKEDEGASPLPDAPKSEDAEHKTTEDTKNDIKDDSSSSDTEEYKARIADLEKEIKSLNDKLSKAQKDNQRANMADAAGQKDAASILGDLAKSFM